MVFRGNSPNVDHVYIACLECRFVGDWIVSNSDMFYTARGDSAEIRLVQLDGTRKYIKLKYGAFATLLPSNVLTYEGHDEVQSVYVDERKKGATKEPGQ